MEESTLLRFINKIEFTDSCWLWSGATTKGGYPKFKLRSYVLVLAHRQSYEWWVGPLIEGLTIDHLPTCKITCVNPDHLEQVTREENSYRRAGTTATHCRQGHLRSVYEQKYPNGKKYCGECNRENHRLEYANREWDKPWRIK